MHGLAMAASRGALVVKELSVNENGPVFVRLVGRRSGLVAWLLALIGIDPTTSLEVFADRIDLSEGSLSGQVRQAVPLVSVCNLGFGYCKPFVLLVVAVMLLFLSLALALQDGAPGVIAVLFLLLAAGCVVAYFLKKTLLIFALSGCGMGPVISFKRSVIEGVAVDESQARRIVEIITSLVERQLAQ